MDPFLKRMMIEKDHLSSLEKRVLDYFVQNTEIIDVKTLQEISDNIFISTATISRTFKKLGFEGYQDWKYSYLSYLERENKNKKDDIVDQDLSSIIDAFNLEINENIRYIGRGITQQLINKIVSSRYVEFFGVGNSYPICQEGARKMTFAGRIASARGDWDELTIVAKTLNSDDLAILISLSGETSHMITYAKILQKNNVPILAIIGSESSHLENYASYTLTTSINSKYYGQTDISFRYTLSMTIDLLVFKILSRNKCK